MFSSTAYCSRVTGGLGEKMNFLSIPEEVIEGSILPYLSWNDLLRFRRVCKVTHEITQDYMRIRPQLAPEIEIGEDDTKRSFRAFLELNIPTTRIFLSNPSGYTFYEKNGKNIAKFLEKCGPLVKHLRVKKFSVFLYGKEWDFLDALVNLQSFEAEHFGFGMDETTTEAHGRTAEERAAYIYQDPRFVNNLLPNIFSQVKSLRVGSEEDIMLANINNRTGTFLKKGHSLEHASLPFCSKNITTPRFTLPIGYHQRHAMGLVFQIINRQIEQRASKYPDKSNLKTFDFCGYHNEVGFEAAEMQAAGSRMFIELLENCVKYGVQLKNVGSLWFNDFVHRPEVISPDIGIPVLSLADLDSCVFPVNMPNLERVEIQATSRSSPGPQWREHRPDWPALTSVDITANCTLVSSEIWRNGQQVGEINQNGKAIFQFFFQDIRRTNLTEIRLHFTKEAGQVSIPKTDDIVDSCPNLKKITLVKWPGTNKALTKLWDGLPALEEISLEYCKGLGNVAFVGQDANNPVFFKHKKLSKLSLKGLDQMPKITDTLFSLVLRHLNLTHLILTSDCPLQSITPAGISSLLEGNFAETIEKFPFQHWSLEGLSAEMEAKFRSYNMI